VADRARLRPPDGLALALRARARGATLRALRRCAVAVSVLFTYEPLLHVDRRHPAWPMQSFEADAGEEAQSKMAKAKRAWSLSIWLSPPRLLGFYPLTAPRVMSGRDGEVEFFERHLARPKPLHEPAIVSVSPGHGVRAIAARRAR